MALSISSVLCLRGLRASVAFILAIGRTVAAVAAGIARAVAPVSAVAAAIITRAVPAAITVAGGTAGDPGVPARTPQN